MNSSLFIAGIGFLRGKVDRNYTGSVLMGMGRVNSLARALSTVRVTRHGNCAAIADRHSNRARSTAVTSVTMTAGDKRVGANSLDHDSHVTGCGRLLHVRRRLNGHTMCKCGGVTHGFGTWTICVPGSVGRSYLGESHSSSNLERCFYAVVWSRLNCGIFSSRSSAIVISSRGLAPVTIALHISI